MPIKKKLVPTDRTRVSFEVLYKEGGQIAIVNPNIEGEAMSVNLFCAIINGVVEVENKYNEFIKGEKTKD